MRKLRELLRLRLHNKLEGRAIARSLGLSPSTVSDYLARARVAGLKTWPLPPELDDDAALTRLLFPSEGQPRHDRPEPDYATIHAELKKPGVTKLLLWHEYKATHPEGYQYSQFCLRYDAWERRLGVTMRQTHRAGEKLFVDFSGDGLSLVEPKTGEVRKARLFVAVLGASNLTYVEPILSEDLPTWVGCHVRALEFFGGVPVLWVPDNLKSGVSRPDFYEPDINPTYAELARHYGAAVIPARKRKPRDKAKVEQGVLLAERWILAVLRKQTFCSLAQLREAIAPLLTKLNDRKMRKLGKSRRQLFEELERGVLAPLPDRPYELAEWKQPQVSIDYHVEFDSHFYSVPYQLVGQRVDLRATESSIELFQGGRRITSHIRSRERNGHTTLTEHMPSSHRAYAEWTPSKVLAWGRTIGPCTERMLEELMLRRPHPEQGFRSCLGVMKLGTQYPGERLERACARALKYSAYSYRSLTTILAHNLDLQPLEEPAEVAALPRHGNVRGSDYYH
jgi:transposase